MKKLILASTSPYRAELLSRLGLAFEQINSNVDEDAYKEQISDPIELAQTLALKKAQSVFQNHPEAFVIGGDQLSLLEPCAKTQQKQVVLGKPGNFKGAVAQLSLLESLPHKLITCVSILGPNQFSENFLDTTTLHMRPLSKEEIESYVEKEEPFNCAGSYKIESLGISLFDQVQTNDSTAIVGLPLIQLAKSLRNAGFQLP